MNNRHNTTDGPMGVWCAVLGFGPIIGAIIVGPFLTENIAALQGVILAWGLFVLGPMVAWESMGE